MVWPSRLQSISLLETLRNFRQRHNKVSHTAKSETITSRSAFSRAHRKLPALLLLFPAKLRSRGGEQRRQNVRTGRNFDTWRESQVTPARRSALGWPVSFPWLRWTRYGLEGDFLESLGRTSLFGGMDFPLSFAEKWFHNSGKHKRSSHCVVLVSPSLSIQRLVVSSSTHVATEIECLLRLAEHPMKTFSERELALFARSIKPFRSKDPYRT